MADGTTITNPSGYAEGTAGDDVFRITASTEATLDGAEGTDQLVVDQWIDEGSDFEARDDFDTGIFNGTVRPVSYYGAGITFFNMEDVRFTGTDDDDRFALTIKPSSVGSNVVFVAGGGHDSLLFNLSEVTQSLTFDASGDTITSTFGSFSGFEQFEIHTGAGDDVLRTGAGDDFLYGGGGTNILESGAGNDQLYTESITGRADGGAGDYDFWNGSFVGATTALTIDVGDDVAVNGQVVATNMEAMTYGGGGHDDVVTVTVIHDSSVYGGEGHDLLVSEIATSDPLDVLIQAYDGGIDGNVGTMSFYEFEGLDLTGGAGDDQFRLIGLFDAEAIALDGGAGNDMLTAQFDVVDGPTTFEMAADGSITSNRGEFADFEAFSLLGGGGDDVFVVGGGNDYLSGGGGDDHLSAGAGVDVLFGDTGDDTMEGGAGDDYYYVNSAGDVAIEQADEGNDIVFSEVSYTLGANFESLMLGYTPDALSGTGNAAANTIAGNDLDNILMGLGGDDVLTGGYGADRLDGGDGADRLDGEDGDDQLSGGNGDDVLNGGYGADLIDGGNGADILLGDAGDTMTGGNGADQFVFEGGFFADATITDLAIEDVISLGNTGWPPLTSFIGDGDFTGAAGEFRYTAADGQTHIEVDANGDAVADSVLTIANGEFALEEAAGSDGSVHQLFIDTQLFTLSVPDGGEAAIGGFGQVVGDHGVQDVTVLDAPGRVSFDPSFNTGGDRIHLAGDAAAYTVVRDGSTIVISDGDTTIDVPAGVHGADIVFDDGSRTVTIDTASNTMRLGDQAVTTTATSIGTPAQAPTATGATDPDAAGHLALAEDGTATFGGNATVFGTSTGHESVTVLAGSEVRFDPSFNQGGDTIALEGDAGAYEAVRSGSTLVLTGGDGELDIPVGLEATTIAFADGARDLYFDNDANAVMLGDQVIGTTAEPVDPAAAAMSAMVPVI